MQVVQAVTSMFQVSGNPCGPKLEGRGSAPRAICFFDTNAGAVTTAARDLVHRGWKLLHHPLYGNYRPRQQPYRSLLLAAPSPETAGPDMDSLHLIEEALLVYNNNKALFPAAVPAALREACALLDYELMRLPLEQSGVIPEGHCPSAPPEREEETFWNRAWSPAGRCA